MTETPMTEQRSLDLVQDSLLRRMRTMHGLYYQAVGSMELEHVNHFERDGVLPIAFSLFHYTNMHDGAFMMLSGQLPIWNEDWQARVQMAIDDAGKERPVSDMIHQRIGDYDAFKDYQRTVFDRTEAHIAAMDPADFQRVLVAPPYPPQIASTYSAMCAGPAGITVLDGYECWLYQHGLRHMGEIELARGLVGSGGDDLMSEAAEGRPAPSPTPSVKSRSASVAGLRVADRSAPRGADRDRGSGDRGMGGRRDAAATRDVHQQLACYGLYTVVHDAVHKSVSNRDPKYARWDTICGNVGGATDSPELLWPSVEPPAASRPHQHRSRP